MHTQAGKHPQQAVSQHNRQAAGTVVCRQHGKNIRCCDGLQHLSLINSSTILLVAATITGLHVHVVVPNPTRTYIHSMTAAISKAVELLNSGRCCNASQQLHFCHGAPSLHSASGLLLLSMPNQSHITALSNVCQDFALLWVCPQTGTNVSPFISLWPISNACIGASSAPLLTIQPSIMSRHSCSYVS